MSRRNRALAALAMVVAQIGLLATGAPTTEAQTPPIASLYGVVSDSTGVPVASARVRLLTLAGALVVETTTESQPLGAYAFSGLTPGTYQLVASKGTESVLVNPIALAGGANVERDLPMSAGLFTITGSFVEADGDPLRPFMSMLSTTCPDGNNSQAAITGDTFTTLVSNTTTCTLAGSLGRSTFNSTVSDNANYTINATLPTTTGNYTWTAPTTPVTIQVIDGSGNNVPINQIGANYSAPMMGANNNLAGPDNTTWRIQSFMHTRTANTMSGATSLPGTTHTIDVPTATNITINIRTTNGLTLTQTVDTTITNTVTFRPPTLPTITGSFVEADGDPLRPFMSMLSTTCPDGNNSQAAITGDTFTTLVSNTTTCTLAGSLGRSTFNSTVSDNANYTINATLPTTTGNYTWTAPTTPVTIQVLDGSGNNVPINQIGANYSTPWGATNNLAGPDNTTWRIQSFMHTRTANTMSGATSLPGTTHTIDVPTATNITINIRTTNGLTLSQTVDTTITNTVTFRPPTLPTITGSFVEADGDPLRPFMSMLSTTCPDGNNSQAAITGDTFTTLVSNTTTCTLAGSLGRSTFNSTVSDNANYTINATLPTTTGNYTWTAPTTPVTIQVIDGSGNNVPINQIGANYSAPMMGANNNLAGPDNTTWRIQSFMHTRTANTMSGATSLPGTTHTIDVPTATNITINIRTTNGLTLSRVIDTSAGPATIEVVVAGSVPVWIVSAPGLEQDGDSVDDYTESHVPALPGYQIGDGNGDGFQDAEQAHVTSFPGPSGDYVTIAAPAGTTLENVKTIPVVTSPPNAPAGWKLPPAGWTLPEGLTDFKLTGLTPGESVNLAFFTSDPASINAYGKFHDRQWISLPVLKPATNDRVVVTLTDGGVGDDDGIANGEILDPGGPGWIPLPTDTTPPTVSISGAAEGAKYELGSAVPTCSASDSGSGLAGPCTVVVTGGNANGVGQLSATATATDNDGNLTTLAVSYKVVYRWTGYSQPINDTAHQSGVDYSVFKAGSTVPAKFTITDAQGNVVTPLAAPIWLAPAKGVATSRAVDESEYTLPADSGTTYSAAGSQWKYNWKSDKSQAGYYWRIGVRLDDGEIHYVNIALR